MRLYTTSALVVGLVSLLPPNLSTTLQRLELWAQKCDTDLQPVAIAALLRSLPQLVEVKFSDVRPWEGVALAVKALRGLQKLKSLHLVDSDGLVHESLALFPHFDRLGRCRMPPPHPPPKSPRATRQYPPRPPATSFPRNNSAIPDVPSPATRQLANLGEKRLEAGLLLFSVTASPSRKLEVRVAGEYGEVMVAVDIVNSCVGQHRRPLKEVRAIGHSWDLELAEQEDQEAIDKLEDLCKKERISFDFEVRVP